MLFLKKKTEYYNYYPQVLQTNTATTAIVLKLLKRHSEQPLAISAIKPQLINKK